MPDIELKAEFTAVCPHCRKAKEMQLHGEEGHTLRFRGVNQEWVHDFVKGAQFTHAYCQATPLRKQNAYR